MGYGMALICGLRINQNFAHPFFAPNVVIFWRRWHISLGRFLSRYILEPNLGLFATRKTKIIFASSIFLISALWHGGTYNYILWGAFHASCYFIYVQKIKWKKIPRIFGIMTMICFFIMGRFLAIDRDAPRLLEKLHSLLFSLFIKMSEKSAGSYISSPEEIKALLVASAFLLLEGVNIRLYGVHKAYHLLRKPLSALIFLITFLFFGMNSGNLLYARI